MPWCPLFVKGIATHAPSRRSRARRAVHALAVLGLAAAPGALAVAADSVSIGQPKVSITPRASRKPEAARNIRVDVKLILIPVTVTDAMDRPVNDLPANAFQILEDNVEQEIVSFSSEEGPVSVGFIFDTSSSMRNRIDKSTAAVQQFLQSTIPGDEFFLVRFSDSPSLETRFTTDESEIVKRLSSIQPRGWTALLDAIYFGAHQMKQAKNPRRTLIILSDGYDNNSRYSESEVRNMILESDIRVFSIGLFSQPRFLQRLAAETGGRAYQIHNLADLPGVIEKLNREVRSQYVLGYAPKHSDNDGRYRKVTVSLLRSILPTLRLAWRHGYYAPAD